MATLSLHSLLPKRLVFASEITTATKADVIDAIFEAAAQQRGAYVCFTNVHMLMEADRSAAFQQVLNRADLALPDGAPVAMYLTRKYTLAQERMPGMDMLPILLQEAEQRGKSVFFYGGTQMVLDAIVEKIGLDFPALRVAGTLSPPYRPLTLSEDADFVAQINNAQTDLLFVALGCPKQEKWMAEHQPTIKACMLGVGQAFLTYAGLEKRLPPLLRKLPLEWLYRLVLEPRRLFKRYAVTNTRFLWKVMKGD